jgi:hypothetical protein
VTGPDGGDPTDQTDPADQTPRPAAGGGAQVSHRRRTRPWPWRGAGCVPGPTA